jgi:hypothetical protein
MRRNRYVFRRRVWLPSHSDYLPSDYTPFFAKGIALLNKNICIFSITWGSLLEGWKIGSLEGWQMSSLPALQPSNFVERPRIIEKIQIF